jgi:putative heme transporter
VDDAQFPATAGSERADAARRPGIPKSPRAGMGTVAPLTVAPVTVAPVTVAPVTGSASGAGSAPDLGGQASQKVASPWRRRGRLGLTAVAAGAVVVLLVRERDLIASSFRVAAHLEWAWFVLAVALESLSLASFARMQCRLLRAGARRVRPLPVMATAYAGNALSATLPLVGAQMSTVFVFRRFKQLGVDASVAGWALVVAGVVSSLASALLFVVGAILSGNDVVAATGAAGGAVGLGFFALATAAIRRPAVLGVVHRPAGWVLRQAWRVLGRPAQDPDAVLGDLVTRLGSLRLPPSGWLTVVLLAFLNWLADAGVLAASIAAVGAPVPWRDLLFVYAVGTAVASAGVVPGGLGVVEGALALTLMGAGLRHPVALAAVLIYRLISFWIVISVGWLIYFLGPRTGHRESSRRAAPRQSGLAGPLGDVELRVPTLVDLQSGSVSGPARQRRQQRTA